VLQVSDITAFGSAEEAAKVLLPKGARLLGLKSQTVEMPPKDTPLGRVDTPPKSYYL
jgi:hypothetical protein